MAAKQLKQDLESRIGTEIKVSDWIEIDQERINLFADATGDHQWIHVDPERARRESPFGDAVAHGFLTLSLIPHLIGTSALELPEAKDVKLGVNYGLNRVRFPAPVLVGSRVRARSTLLSVEEVGDNALQLASQVTLEVENGSKPCCVAETLSRLYF